MSPILKTQSGTLIHNGIEFNKFPPPSSLIKAMERKWAILLRERGQIRLSSTKYYQKLEKLELGDRNEGLGMLRLEGHQIESSSVNEVYIWCCAYPETSINVLKSLNKPAYDIIICILDEIRNYERGT